MDWFRHYHGLCTDPKLHRIARTAKVSRGLVIAAWCAILETASQNDPRGYADDIDEASLAFMIDVKPSAAGRILAAVRDAGLLDENGEVAAWGKRQRASDDVAQRVAKSRERSRVNEVLGKKRYSTENVETAKTLPDKETCIAGNVTVTSRTEQNRTEQKEDISPYGDSSEALPPDRPLRLTPRERYPAQTSLPKNGKGLLYPDEFEAAWQAYPKRAEDTKPGCYKHWRSWVVERRVDPEMIIEGAKAYARAKAMDEHRFGFRRWCSEGLWTQEASGPRLVASNGARPMMPGEW